MWESPIYKFNVEAGTHDGDRLYKQVVIDVTGSAPSFDGPGKTLGKALAVALAEAAAPRRAVILDFGAGKLRNTLHLLNKGFRVCAVEYEQLFADSTQATSALARAVKYRARFAKLVFPHQFVRSRARFDFVLLINVLNIMPVPAERLAVLKLCHEKLIESGYLLWYTQRGDRAYADRMLPRYRLGDGYFVGRRAKLKTFYREFTVAEIDQLLEASGFELVSPINASPRNQARLYRRLDVSPIHGVIDSNAIDAAGIVDERIPLPDKVKPRLVSSSRSIRRGHPDPPELRIESLYVEQLIRIPAGGKAAARYQRHVKAIIELVFGDELRDIRAEVGMFGGRKRLDIIARNKSQGGFFRSLKDDGRPCPYIVIECKNYRDELGNPEFDQLGSRLGRKLGRVGLLAYRSARDRRRVIARCGDLQDNDDKLVIPLSDSDLTEILRLKQADNNRGIESYLDGIVEEIVRQ